MMIEGCHWANERNRAYVITFLELARVRLKSTVQIITILHYIVEVPVL